MAEKASPAIRTSSSHCSRLLPKLVRSSEPILVRLSGNVADLRPTESRHPLDAQSLLWRPPWNATGQPSYGPPRLEDLKTRRLSASKTRRPLRSGKLNLHLSVLRLCARERRYTLDPQTHPTLVRRRRARLATPFGENRRKARRFPAVPNASLHLSNPPSTERLAPPWADGQCRE